MADLKEIVNDGIVLKDSARSNDLDIAFSSLGIALESYFSTYQACKFQLSSIERGYNSLEEEQFNYTSSYYKSCVETIIHFQHFFELSCKKILKDEHPLLSDVASTTPLVLHKLLKGGSLSGEDESSLRSIEFSEALKRLNVLIKNEKIPDFNNLKFITSHTPVLEAVNGLRNRIWHRGLFVLRYKSLDELICKHILPLVRNFISLDGFSEGENIWMYKHLDCGLNPIDELISEYTNNPNANLRKVAFLKELGRAAYKNPLIVRHSGSALRDFASLHNNEFISRAEKLADAMEKKGGEVRKRCPVCAVNSLIISRESEVECDENDTVTNSYEFTYQVNCECCELSLYSGFENASSYGFNNIEDYWY